MVDGEDSPVKTDKEESAGSSDDEGERGDWLRINSTGSSHKHTRVGDDYQCTQLPEPQSALK